MKESLSAYALHQNLLKTFSNPLSIKLKLCGGGSKNCSKQNKICVFVIMLFTHLFDILALKNKIFGHFDPPYCK